YCVGFNAEIPPENIPPVADAVADPMIVMLGTGIDFDGTGSTDSDGTIVSYYWDFTTGDTANTATTTYIFSATGTYSVVLTVTDDDNATGTDMVIIIVEEGDNPINSGDVIINELMWMGSATSTADEWIELKNTTGSAIDLDECRLIKKNGDTIASLAGQNIDANGYLVISRKSQEDSNIDTVTQNILSYLALSNTELKIELYCGETLIDTAGDGDEPLAGDNDDPKRSMQKCGDDWEDALVGGVANNWDAETTELGTPGLANVCELENTPPTILGADNPLIFYVGDVNTELELDELARLDVTATDTEDVIPAGDIVITGLGSVSTSTVSTTTISYDVDDYGNPALSAQTVVREVRTVTQCSDELDNDADTLIDEEDPGCWTDTNDPNSYDPDDNDESYDGPGYPQCSDELDNDQDGVVDSDDSGCWTDPTDPTTYDPEDDDEYYVPAPYCGDSVCNGSETCSTCSQDCGGCGGGGGGGWFFPVTINISQEDVEYLGAGSALVTWRTNIPATSQVVYGDDSINRSDFGSVPEYGYDSVNEEALSLKTTHSMLITGLTHGTQYYFRPVSDKSGVTEVIGKEVTYTFIQVPPVCNYLLEYIQLGANNNSVEVEKLENFLNEFEGESLVVNGIYEQVDYEAVKRFQMKYREDILDPWTHDESTGYVYITTKKKINEIYCEREFPLTTSQEAEVISFSSLMEGLQGATTGALGEAGTLDVGNIVGS
ncbi:MAG: lamin tail domain-containing protein, partial [Candidatus Pacebacteria bacterium]|nr:lamin tail domain-containing protein [Candidatus Paceibacterota bacterium]